MWDDSLPSYDGSIEHNIILLTLYLRFILYYIIFIFGIITLIILIISPFIGLYFGYNSIKIKIKQSKDKKYTKTKQENQKKSDEFVYLNHLDEQYNKKKKYKYGK
jgi:hypothetical protein